MRIVPSPFVFLVALGEGYHIFLVFRLWQEASHDPLPKAIATGVAETNSLMN